MRKYQPKTLWNLAVADWVDFKVVDRYFPEPPYEPIKHGSWTMERKVIEENDPQRLRTIMDGRDCGTGPTAILRRDGHPWMSDTQAEIVDHLEVIDAIAWPSSKRVLINGLGLGVVLNAALSFDHVEHVDVVEYDIEVITFIGKYFKDDPRVTIHHGDAYTYKFPRGTRWDIVWHDIWPTISMDNLPGIRKLKNRYGHRCDWQGAWVEDVCRYLRWYYTATDEQVQREEWKRYENLFGKETTKQIKHLFKDLEENGLASSAVPRVCFATMPEEATI